MIYFIRHGEAAASWGEHPNPGLSENGFQQAKQVAGLLGLETISAIVSSPMQRCQDTAAAFSEASGLPVRVDPKVSEIPTPTEIEDRVVWLRGLMNGTWAAAPDIVKTWRENLIEAAEALPDGTVVFSHFVAINALVGHLEGLSDVTVFRPTYCSVTRLQQQDGRLQLVQRGGEADTKIL